MTPGALVSCPGEVALAEYLSVSGAPLEVLMLGVARVWRLLVAEESESTALLEAAAG
jgi:hypothetical protein